MLTSLYAMDDSTPAGKRAHGDEVVRALALNLQSAHIESAHVLYEGASTATCHLLRREVGDKAHCVPTKRQPTYLDFFQYAAVTLAGTVVLLTNPDMVYDFADLANIRPALVGDRSMFTFSAQPPPVGLLQLTTGSPEAASRCLVDRARGVMVNYCSEAGTRCLTAHGRAAPCSWDGFLFRAPAELPPVARRLRFPMNIHAAEAWATSVLRDDLGFDVRNGCHFVRSYNAHCAAKTNQLTTSRWPGHLWQYDLDTMTLNSSQPPKPMPPMPRVCGERAAAPPKELLAPCTSIVVDKYGRNGDKFEAAILAARARGERDVNDWCAPFFPPLVKCPELGEQQRSFEHTKGSGHLAATPQFGRAAPAPR